MILALAGCSFIQPPRSALPTTGHRISCPYGVTPPVLDGIVAAGGLGVGIGVAWLSANRDGAGFDNAGLAGIPMIVGLALAVPFAVAAAYGIKNRNTCRDNNTAEKIEHRLVIEEVAELMNAALAASRSRDCRRVREIDADVRANEQRFHRDVFRRDPEIAVCLHAPAGDVVPHCLDDATFCLPSEEACLEALSLLPPDEPPRTCIVAGSNTGPNQR